MLGLRARRDRYNEFLNHTPLKLMAVLHRLPAIASLGRRNQSGAPMAEADCSHCYTGLLFIFKQQDVFDTFKGRPNDDGPKSSRTRLLMVTLRGIGKTCLGARKRARKGAKSSQAGKKYLRDPTGSSVNRQWAIMVLDHLWSSLLCYSTPVPDTCHLLEYFDSGLRRIFERENGQYDDKCSSDKGMVVVLAPLCNSTPSILSSKMDNNPMKTKPST